MYSHRTHPLSVSSASFLFVAYDYTAECLQPCLSRSFRSSQLLPVSSRKAYNGGAGMMDGSHSSVIGHTVYHTTFILMWLGRGGVPGRWPLPLCACGVKNPVKMKGCSRVLTVFVVRRFWVLRPWAFLQVTSGIPLSTIRLTTHSGSLGRFLLGTQTRHCSSDRHRDWDFIVCIHIAILAYCDYRYVFGRMYVRVELDGGRVVLGGGGRVFVALSVGTNVCAPVCLRGFKGSPVFHDIGASCLLEPRSELRGGGHRLPIARRA